MLKDFFESNSVSMSIIESYEDFCMEKNPKTALNAVRRELYEEYADERDQEIVFFMTIYWCGLQKGFVDEKSKSTLELLTEPEICTVFEKNDSLTISKVLDELLKTPPIPRVRKKIDYSNPGSKNWKVGDVYAYAFTNNKYEHFDLSGKICVIYCSKIEKRSTRKNDVIVYIFICDKNDIKNNLKEILKNSICVMSFASRGYYQYKLFSSHHEYPKESLLYLGNIEEFNSPADEIIPPTTYHIPLLCWERFESIISQDMSHMS